MRHAIERECPPNYIWILPEFAFPETIGDNSDIGAFLVLWPKGAAKDRAHPEHVDERITVSTRLGSHILKTFRHQNLTKKERIIRDLDNRERRWLESIEIVRGFEEDKPKADKKPPQKKPAGKKEADKKAK